MKPRARKERAILRARRQGWDHGTLRAWRSRRRQTKAGLWPRPHPSIVAALFEQYTVSEGMAYVTGREPADHTEHPAPVQPKTPAATIQPEILRQTWGH